MNGSARTVRFADGGSIDAHTVILATGVSWRRLKAPGLDEFTGRGVFYGSALSEAPASKGRTSTSWAGRTRPARPRSTPAGTPAR
ncbi:MAG: hypothetical protein U0R72_17640 [Nakamurella multipartita]